MIIKKTHKKMLDKNLIVVYPFPHMRLCALAPMRGDHEKKNKPYNR